MAAFSLPSFSSKSAPSPSRRVRIVSGGVVSESVLRSPAPDLEGLVASEYQGWTESSVEVVRRREVPTGAFPFIINFGSPFRLADPMRLAGRSQRLSTFTAGIYDSFVIVESQGDSCCIQVNFTPIGARLFFQLPLGELANRSVALEELFGDHAQRVVEALAEAGDWDRRFDLLEALIQQRVRAAKPARPQIVWAWGEMQQSCGRVDIGLLAQQLGWSHKHLIAQFRDHLGAPPRHLGRLLRFQHTLLRIAPSGPPRWAALAFDCGYADQSHLIREFQQFAGCTPQEYVRLQLPHGGVSASAPSTAENFTRR